MSAPTSSVPVPVPVQVRMQNVAGAPAAAPMTVVAPAGARIIVVPPVVPPGFVMGRGRPRAMAGHGAGFSGSEDCCLRMVTRRPCLTCWVTIVLAAIISGIGLMDGIDVNTEGWDARGTELSNRQAPYTLYSGEFNDGNDDAPNDEYMQYPGARRRLLQTQTCAAMSDSGLYYDGANVEVIFEAAAGVDLFTADAFAEMCEYAEGYVSHESVNVDGRPMSHGDVCRRQDYCQTLPSGARLGEPWEYWRSRDYSNFDRCSRVYSLATSYYPLMGATSCSEYRTNPTLRAGVATLKNYMLNCAALKAVNETAECGSSVFDYNEVLLDTNFGLDGKTDLTYTRAVVQNQDFNNAVSWAYSMYNAGVPSSLNKEYGSSLFSSYVDTSWSEVREQLVDEQLWKDMALASGSVVIILVLMWLRTGSVFLTVGGVTQILLSFPSAIFFTKMICGLDYFPFLNFIGLFVIAGIGADDCFVMYDKYQQAKSRCVMGASSTQVAMRSYWDSVWAMALTSTTTAAAFFANAMIPIAPIRVFAILMGSMVVFDYLYDITIFAAMLSWQHDKIVEIERTGRNTAAAWLLDFWGSLKRARTNKPFALPQQTQDARTKNDATRRSGQEAFLSDRVFPFVYTLRWFFVVALLAIFAGDMYAALQLKAPKDSEVSLLPEDHMLSRFSFLKRSAFKSSDESTVWNTVLFGVHPEDDGDHFNPQSRPSFSWDTTFDLAPEASQNWLMDFYQTTRSTMADNDRGYFWLENMDNWLRYDQDASTSSAQATCGNANSIPVPESNFYDCAKLFADNRNPYMMQRPLSNAFYTDSSGKTRMKIMTIEFATDVMWTAPVEDLSNTWDRWEEYIKAKMADAPVGLKNGYQTSEAWAWMDTITQMKEGSYLAAATTLAIAGVTTMISSNNIFIALYSLLSILCILVTTIASVISMGWTLGFLEGICITILIGLSVDYVVHIGHAYASAMRVEGTTRKECARHALATMGFPVLSAALTSLAASLLLLGAVITFFTKFGTIVILSTIYATLTSTILLIALLAAAGPVNGVGDVKCLCRRRHQSATRHHQHGANML